MVVSMLFVELELFGALAMTVFGLIILTYGNLFVNVIVVVSVVFLFFVGLLIMYVM